MSKGARAMIAAKVRSLNERARRNRPECIGDWRRTSSQGSGELRRSRWNPPQLFAEGRFLLRFVLVPMPALASRPSRRSARPRRLVCSSLAAWSVDIPANLQECCFGESVEHAAKSTGTGTRTDITQKFEESSNWKPKSGRLGGRNLFRKFFRNKPKEKLANMQRSDTDRHRFRKIFRNGTNPA